MAKGKGLVIIDGFADECVITGNTENVLRIRMCDGSFSGDVTTDVLLKLLTRKSKAERPKEPEKAVTGKPS